MSHDARFAREKEATKAIDAGPHGWVQWKGTNVCMDLHCACGAHGHIDYGFAYTVKCTICGRVYDVAGSVVLVEVPKDEAETRDWHEPIAFGDEHTREGSEDRAHHENERAAKLSELQPEIVRQLLALEKVEHPGGYSDRCPVCDTDFDGDADSGPRAGPPEGQVHRADCKLGALCDKLRALASARAGS